MTSKIIHIVHRDDNPDCFPGKFLCGDYTEEDCENWMKLHPSEDDCVTWKNLSGNWTFGVPTCPACLKVAISQPELILVQDIEWYDPEKDAY